MAKKIKPPRDPKAEKAERKAEKAAALKDAAEQKQESELKAEEEAAAAAAAQDEFQARGVELADHVHDHPGKVLAILGSVVVSGLLFGIYTAVDKSDNTKASAAYAAALQVWEAPIDANATGAAADDKGTTADKAKLSFKDGNERAKAAKEKFVALAVEHRGTGASALAWLSAGHAALKLGEYDEAVRAYDSFLFAAKDDDPLRFAGLSGLGAAREGRGDDNGAIDAYEKLVLLSDKVAEDDALLQLGRLYKKTGDVETARKRLERLKSDFPQSALRTRADEILGSLGPAASPPAPAPAAPAAAAPAPTAGTETK
jgi:tetratricopeptide (TPR) repeat protein